MRPPSRDQWQNEKEYLSVLDMSKDIELSLSELNTADVSMQEDIAEIQAWTEIPSWIAPTLLNSWVDFGAPFATAGYYKDAFNRVHLQGVVKNGGPGNVIFTLPAGFRPGTRLVFSTVAGGDTLGRLDVDPDGSVVRSFGNNAYFCMQVSFLADG